jgi:hypothetical protein
MYYGTKTYMHRMHAHVLFLFLSFVGGEGRRGRPPIAISNVIMILTVPTTHLLLTETSI